MSGWDDTRWLDTHDACTAGTPGVDERSKARHGTRERRPRARPRRPSGPTPGALAVLGTPDADRRDPERARLNLRERRAMAGATTDSRKKSYGAMRQNALRQLDRGIPRHAGELTMDRPSCRLSCREYTCAQVLRERRERGRARPAGDRARHARPGRHGPLAPSVHAPRPGLALSVYGAEPAREQGLRGGRRRGSRECAGAGARVGVLRRGRSTRCRVLAPTGDRAVRDAAPDAQATRPTRARVLRGSAPALAPGGDGPGDLHAAGKVSVFPAIGYPSPTSRTSRAATTGRSASCTERNRLGWLGRWLDRVGDR